MQIFKTSARGAGFALAVAALAVALSSCPLVQMAPLNSEAPLEPKMCIAKIENSGLLAELKIPAAVSEFVEELRADPGMAGVRILLMTARGSVLERRRGLALGADGFIAKPFELAELRAEMARLLG